MTYDFLHFVLIFSKLSCRLLLLHHHHHHPPPPCPGRGCRPPLSPPSRTPAVQAAALKQARLPYAPSLCGDGFPQASNIHQPGQLLPWLRSLGCRRAVRGNLHHAQGSTSACIFIILLIFSPQDISASSRAIFSRAIQNASGQPSDAVCLDVLRPVLSILSSWPSSLPAHLLWSDVLSTIRTCVEVPIPLIQSQYMCAPTYR